MWTKQCRRWFRYIIFRVLWSRILPTTGWRNTTQTPAKMIDINTECNFCWASINFTTTFPSISINSIFLSALQMMCISRSDAKSTNSGRNFSTWNCRLNFSSLDGPLARAAMIEIQHWSSYYDQNFENAATRQAKKSPVNTLFTLNSFEGTAKTAAILMKTARCLLILFHRFPFNSFNWRLNICLKFVEWAGNSQCFLKSLIMLLSIVSRMLRNYLLCLILLRTPKCIDTGSLNVRMHTLIRLTFDLPMPGDFHSLTVKSSEKTRHQELSATRFSSDYITNFRPQ